MKVQYISEAFHVVSALFICSDTSFVTGFHGETQRTSGTKWGMRFLKVEFITKKLANAFELIYLSEIILNYVLYF